MKHKCSLSLSIVVINTTKQKGKKYLYLLYERKQRVYRNKRVKPQWRTLLETNDKRKPKRKDLIGNRRTKHKHTHTSSLSMLECLWTCLCMSAAHLIFIRIWSTNCGFIFITQNNKQSESANKQQQAHKNGWN